MILSIMFIVMMRPIVRGQSSVVNTRGGIITKTNRRDRRSLGDDSPGHGSDVSPRAGRLLDRVRAGRGPAKPVGAGLFHGRSDLPCRYPSCPAVARRWAI